MSDTGGPAAAEEQRERRRSRREARRSHRFALTRLQSVGESQRARWVLRLVAVLVPVLATVVVAVRLPDEPTDLLVADDPVPDDGGVTIRATLRQVDPSSGELLVRLVPTVTGDLVSEGRLTEPLGILVNDVSGRGAVQLARGDLVQPVDVSLALGGSRLTRYPFDSYEAELGMLVAGEGDEEVPVAIEVVSALDGFTAGIAEGQRAEQRPGGVRVPLELERPPGLVVWALFLMALWWAVAIASASVVWLVLVWNVEVPMWAWGFLIGVLFALPPLRANLPGSPPFGSLVDWGSFYWAIGIVATTLVVLALTWNVRTRQEEGIRERRRSALGRPGADG